MSTVTINTNENGITSSASAKKTYYSKNRQKWQSYGRTYYQKNKVAILARKKIQYAERKRAKQLLESSSDGVDTTSDAKDTPPDRDDSL